MGARDVSDPAAQADASAVAAELDASSSGPRAASAPVSLHGSAAAAVAGAPPVAAQLAADAALRRLPGQAHLPGLAIAPHASLGEEARRTP
jgi:hypothetical protein